MSLVLLQGLGVVLVLVSKPHYTTGVTKSELVQSLSKNVISATEPLHLVSIARVCDGCFAPPETLLPNIGQR